MYICSYAQCIIHLPHSPHAEGCAREEKNRSDTESNTSERWWSCGQRKSTECRWRWKCRWQRRVSCTDQGRSIIQDKRRFHAIDKDGNRLPLNQQGHHLGITSHKFVRAVVSWSQRAEKRSFTKTNKLARGEIFVHEDFWFAMLGAGLWLQALKSAPKTM